MNLGVVSVLRLGLVALSPGGSARAADCPPQGFSTVQDFDVASFVSRRWHVQEQMQVGAVPEHAHRCLHADYARLPRRSFWGYDIQVHNVAIDDAPPNRVHDTGRFLCAKIVDGETGKLAVSPCLVPSAFAGPYWVLAYNETEGYALISGGPPTERSAKGCRTGTGVNNAGLWIFTRACERDAALVRKVTRIAEQKGFDTSVLESANQTGCCSAGQWDDANARLSAIAV
jgi:lipocalin